MLIRLRCSILIICFFLISFSGFCQEHVLIEKQSSISVEGTSSMHDWIVEVKEISGSLILDQKTNQILDLKIKIASKSLTASKRAMDNKIYKALKTSDFAEIEFINVDSQILESIDEKESRLKLFGNLILAGVTKPIQIIAYLKQRSDNINMSGSIEINMKDYSIKPPKALFGTVKVNEIVSISFDTVFK